MSFCKGCISGVLHEGTPEGKIEKIGEVECYVATPTVDYPKDKVVLILTDVFGLGLNNNKLIADGFANNGIKTIIPDYLNGDWLSEEAMSGKVPFNREEWFSKHGPAQMRPPLDKVIAALKKEGVFSLGAAGYCFGARYAFDLAFDQELQAIMVAHPSSLQISDLEKYAQVSKAPLLINSCETDLPFPKDKQEAADQILGGGKFQPGYERLYWEGCTHGFAVRGDMSDPKVKAGKEGAFTSAVEWFIKYL